MQHLKAFAQLLQQHFNKSVVVEPSRATGTDYICLLPGKLQLKDMAQEAGQTDVPYGVFVEVVMSFRLQGGNEGLSLTKQGLTLSIQIAEFMKRGVVPIVTDKDEEIFPGLTLSKHVCFDDFKPVNQGGEFGQFEQDNDKLFIFREDWKCTMQILATRAHTPPKINRVDIKSPDGTLLKRVTNDGG